MKQLKPLKMFVPERADYEWHGLHNGDVPYTSISRSEIHELVKAHAIDIGYNKDFLSDEPRQSIPKDSSWIVLTNEGRILCDNGAFIATVDYEEIQWQDFLKLTPEDVNDTDVVEKNTTDRNEKAWELFRDTFSRCYLPSADKLNIDLVECMIKDCKQAADEFLKQAGNK